MHKRLDFGQLFLDQLIECVSGNKKSTYVPYPHLLGLIWAHSEEGYNFNLGVIIPIVVLSSKITNIAPSNGDMHITHNMTY